MLEGFGLGGLKLPSVLGRECLNDDMSPGYAASSPNAHWTPTLLKDKWVPPHVTGRVGAYNDFPGISLIYPAFSQRAVDALRDYLEPNGELLPLDSDVGVPYYFYNITTFVDAIDAENTECWGRFRDSGLITYPKHLAFHADKLEGLSIFRDYDWPIATLVTDVFVKRVEESGLNGFDFIKCWPFPKGVYWQLENKKHSPQRKVAEKLKQQTLVLIFPVVGKKPNASEKKVIKRYEDELDAQLVIRSLDAPYFGSLEGDEPVEGEMRLFISCPDVDRLVQKLQPWLDHLGWPRTCYAMKRYGKMYDENAEESVIEIG
jgi:hypothetical protein